MSEEEDSFYGEDMNAEYIKEQFQKEQSLRNTARKFFKGEGKELYRHLLYEVCGHGQSPLDVENTYRMTARCAKQEVGNRLIQLVEESFNINEHEEQ